MKALELIQSLSSDDQILLKNILEIQKAIQTSKNIDELVAIRTSFSIMKKIDRTTNKSAFYQEMIDSCYKCARGLGKAQLESFVTRT